MDLQNGFRILRKGMCSYRETLVDDSLNTRNFLEALKLLSCYDMTMQAHLSEVTEMNVQWQRATRMKRKRL